MKFKTILVSPAIAALALIAAHPLVAEAIPQPARTACIRSTAEEMGVPVSSIMITDVGPISAESGAVTVKMQNRTTRQTADCRVNTIDNTVLSVTLGSVSTGGNTVGNTTGQNPQFWVVRGARTFLKASPGVLSKTVTNNVPGGTVLRNLGCQAQTRPTWCKVEFRDDPSVKGWAWSPDLNPYTATTSPSTPSARPGGTVPPLSDLVGARAGQAENALVQRGYELRRSSQQADSSFTYWLERRTGNCVAIRTTDGRYGAIIYTSDRDCNRE